MSGAVNLESLYAAQQRAADVKMNRFKTRLAQDPGCINSAANQIFKKIIDDCTMEIICEFHRAHVFGYTEFLYYPLENSKEESKTKKDEVEKKSEEIIVECPHCVERWAASKFAKHLVECKYGGGRKSKRTANKRIANSSKGSIYVSIPTDDEDEECNIANEKCKPSKKSESGKRNKKHSKQKNSNTPTKNNNKSQLVNSTSNQNDDSIPLTKMKNLPVEEQMAFLSTYCGSKIEPSLPSKPQKSKSHSKSERTITRKLLSSSILSSVVSGNFINIQDLDLPAVESELETGVSLSPADSNSSLSSSSSSYKRKSK